MLEELSEPEKIIETGTSRLRTSLETADGHKGTTEQSTIETDNFDDDSSSEDLFEDRDETYDFSKLKPKTTTELDEWDGSISKIDLLRIYNINNDSFHRY